MKMMLHGSPAQSQASGSPCQPQSPPRKRKADTQDTPQNERLSKRLSLLNLEHNGSKLYVPVENPSQTHPSTMNTTTTPPTSNTIPEEQEYQDEPMHLDNTAHKVYIYNIDDELYSSESEPDDGRLVFLPDIEKHLRQNRIPPSVLANDDGQLAGMQMVLYSEPKALSVPEESDSVRRAVVDARRRLRESQGGRDTGQAASSSERENRDTDMASNRDDENDADDEAMDMD